MKILFRVFLIFSLVLLGSPFMLKAQTMESYCQMPSSIGNPVDPNVLLVVDNSGSMDWCAYTGQSCDTGAYPYVDASTYEGYFDPTKFYQLVSGVWEEYTPTGVDCDRECTGTWKCKSMNDGDCISYGVVSGKSCKSPNRWACCTAWTSTGDCNTESGNYLNYRYMQRVDILKWVLTGGKPQSCDNNTITKCDVSTYPDSSHLTDTCNSDGCILLGGDGSTKVRARWDRLTGDNGGLLFQLKHLSPKPLMGALFYNNYGVTKYVRIGDFTASASYDAVNPYKSTITEINYETPNSCTSTAPALWDAYNYYAQNNPQYNGPDKQTGSGAEWKNPMYYDTGDGNCQGSEFKLVPCAKNFVILLSDGMWNKGGIPHKDGCIMGTHAVCKIDGDIEAESPDPVVPAYYMHKKGFTNSVTGVETYVDSVYTVGLWVGGDGELALKNVAMYGSFDRAKTWPGGTTGFPNDSCGPVTDCCNTANCGKGSNCTDLPASSSSDWDNDGNGVPDTYFKADNAIEIKRQLVEVIMSILRRVSSGSAVSILSSSEGTGANLLQAVYYPRKVYGATEIDWTGEMQNLWYYVDPYLESSTIREDTNIVDEDEGKHILNLGDDYILQLYYDPVDGKTKAKRYSTNSTGDLDTKTYINTVLLEDIKNLWEIGSKLFLRTDARTVYTTTDGSTFTSFSPSNSATLADYLQASNAADASNIIDYVLGDDQKAEGLNYRNRTVTIDATTAVWKLGDIVNSSPRMQASTPLQSYYKSLPDGYADTTYQAYIDSSVYKNRGMSYIGANDGMLHAFKHGMLEQSWTGQESDEKARLTNPATPAGELGSEVWAFIPKSALPYLKYLADPDYCHLYYVDGSSIIFDASIHNVEGTDPDDYANDTKTKESWRTILIGGMGLGGASKITGSTCTTGEAGTCVKTPRTDPADATKGLGYSSYFAIDIYTPETPALLWEFSHPNLGFSTSGPAIVRIGDASKNGKWFAVFASGPTGPIETTEHQFLAKSDQNLKIFILDLKTGDLLRTIDTGITEAFGGSLYNATIDTDKGNIMSGGRYSDDAIYLGYTQKDSTTWTKGGVIRIFTQESANPADWVWSHVIQNIGPVTSAVTKLQDRNKKNLWLYFGSGRYFYRQQSGVDDPNGQRVIYGVKEPCYNTVMPLGPANDINHSCTSSVTTGLEDQSEDTPDPTLPTGATGWYINLGAASGNDGAERVITDPYAVTSGAVFYTTYTPSTDVCEEGGSTAIWAVKYDTGAAISLSGIALMQVSTGAIQELSLKSAFTERGNRKTAAITGMPPKGQGLSLLIGPRPMRKILHMKEK